MCTDYWGMTIDHNQISRCETPPKRREIYPENNAPQDNTCDVMKENFKERHPHQCPSVTLNAANCLSRRQLLERAPSCSGCWNLTLWVPNKPGKVVYFTIKTFKQEKHVHKLLFYQIKIYRCTVFHSLRVGCNVSMGYNAVIFGMYLITMKVTNKCLNLCIINRTQ